jgi:predicted metal-dependent peptidase
MKDIDIRKEITRAIVGVARHKEFYGHVFQQFEKVFVSESHPVKTAAVGRNKGERFIKLYICEKFFLSFYEGVGSRSKQGGDRALKQARDHASGVIEHEVMHVVLHHLLRKYRDRTRGNVAMDLVVNQLLSCERRPPDALMPDRYGLPVGKTANWYYDQLEGNDQFKDDCSGGLGPNDVIGRLDSGHSMWKDVMEDPMAGEFLKDVIRKAKENTSAQGWGSVPGEIRESVEDLLRNNKPQVPWAKVFRNFCASGVDNVLSYTMRRESRRFGIRPGIHKEDLLSVAVIVDTSGSISDLQVSAFFNEVNWIWRNGAEVEVYEADTKVCRHYPYKGKFSGKIHGRGGTNLEPAMAEVENKYDVAVYFTDFWAPKISRQYRIPTLWVLSKEPKSASHWPADWGKVVKIEIE